MDQLQESAAALLLRSPRLSVSLGMELLDISDAEFRALAKDNERISDLLDKRKRGELKTQEPGLKTCPAEGMTSSMMPARGARCSPSS